MRKGTYGLGIVEGVMLGKQLDATEGRLKVAAGKTAEKNMVVIAWPGAPYDGMAGALEGEPDGKKRMVRLTFSGAVVKVPEDCLRLEGEKITLAASLALKAEPAEAAPAAKPAEKKDNKVTKVEPPVKLEKVQPKDILIDQARTAPEGGGVVKGILEKLHNLESQIKAKEASLKKFREELSLEVVTTEYKARAKELYDLLALMNTEVVKVGEVFVARATKTDILEANLSKESLRDKKKLEAKIEEAQAKIDKAEEEIADLEAASFGRLGGTERVTERVTEFTDPNKKKVAGSLIEWLSSPRVLAGLSADNLQKRHRLDAGLKEMFKSAIASVKSIFSDIKEMFSAAKDFVKNLEKDLDKAGKSQPKPNPVAAAKAKKAGAEVYGVWNGYDGIAALPEQFHSEEDARAALKKFIERFKEQGYFSTGGHRVPYEALLEDFNNPEDEGEGLGIFKRSYDPETFEMAFTPCPGCSSPSHSGSDAGKVEAAGGCTGDIDKDFDATDVDMVAEVVAEDTVMGGKRRGPEPLSSGNVQRQPVQRSEGTESKAAELAKHLADKARQIYKGNANWGQKLLKREKSQDGARDQLYVWMAHWADAWEKNGGRSNEAARDKKFGSPAPAEGAAPK